MTIEHIVLACFSGWRQWANSSQRRVDRTTSNTDQQSALLILKFFFTYAASFRNDGHSKAIWVKKRGRISALFYLLWKLDRKPTANRRSVCLRRQTFMWPWPLTHDLENLTNLWPDCGKYSCKFWLKSLWSFRCYWIHKISTIMAGWPWPLTFSMSTLSRGPRNDYLWPVSLKYLHSFKKGLKRQTDARSIRLLEASGVCRRGKDGRSVMLVPRTNLRWWWWWYAMI